MKIRTLTLLPALFLLVQLHVSAQDWRWTGDVSSNWSDLGN